MMRVQKVSGLQNLFSLCVPEMKSTCFTRGIGGEFGGLAVRKPYSHSMLGTPPLPSFLLPAASMMPQYLDGSPPALEEFSAIITAFSAIYCQLNPNVSQPCLVAVYSIDWLSEWHCSHLVVTCISGDPITSMSLHTWHQNASCLTTCDRI